MTLIIAVKRDENLITWKRSVLYNINRNKMKVKIKKMMINKILMQNPSQKKFIMEKLSSSNQM